MRGFCSAENAQRLLIDHSVKSGCLNKALTLDLCGFGGLFSTKFPEVSGAMADRKLDTLPPVDFVTSADGGCLLQLSGRASHRGTAPPFRHLASVLWEATRP